MDIERSDVGFGDFEKYKGFLEVMLNFLKGKYNDKKMKLKNLFNIVNKEVKFKVE